MIAAVAQILLCQLCGEAAHRLLGVPIPGPVLGMLLLLGWLAATRRTTPALDRVAAFLTGNLALLFLPPAVGLIEQGAILRHHAVAIVAAIIVSTLMTAAVSAAVFRAVAARTGAGQ